MADTGAPWNLPYPLDTDLVKDGAEAIEDLALAVDAGLDATKVATNLTSGTLPSARISGSYTGLTGTGALNAGSITSGFGSINNGSSSITTTGAITGGTLSGNGSSITNLTATNLTGTIVSARISGSYTGITGTGALNAGSITSGFGNINIGSSTFTGNGSGLTDLDATDLTGTINQDRLPVLNRKTYTASNAITEVLDFSTGDEIIRKVRLADVTFQGTSYTEGVEKKVIWDGGSNPRNVTFPASWVFVTTKPTSLPGNKRGYLSVVCHGTTEAEVTAQWFVEP